MRFPDFGMKSKNNHKFSVSKEGYHLEYFSIYSLLDQLKQVACQMEALVRVFEIELFPMELLGHKNEQYRDINYDRFKTNT
jgi:hypothetical protein